MKKSDTTLPPMQAAQNATPTVRCVTMGGRTYVKLSKSALSLFGAPTKNAKPRVARVSMMVFPRTGKVGLCPPKKESRAHKCSVGRISWLRNAMIEAGFDLQPGTRWEIRRSSQRGVWWEISKDSARPSD